MLYIGNVLLAGAFQTALTVISWLSNVSLLAVSLAAVAVFPGVSYFALLLLFLQAPVDSLWRIAGI